MRDALPVGAAIPMRERGDRMQALMVRRSYWHPTQDRARNHAGEWVFPASTGHVRGNDSRRRAELALRKELGYRGECFVDPIPFHRGEFRRYHRNSVAQIAFYRVWVEEDAELELRNDELIDKRWDTPKNHWEHVTSDRFRNELLRAYKSRGLIRHAAEFVRHPPREAHEALKKLKTHY